VVSGHQTFVGDLDYQNDSKDKTLPDGNRFKTHDNSTIDKQTWSRNAINGIQQMTSGPSAGNLSGKQKNQAASQSTLLIQTQQMAGRSSNPNAFNPASSTN